MNATPPDRQLALLVDDDPVVLLLATKVLEESGLRIVQASTAIPWRGISWTRQVEPDVDPLTAASGSPVSAPASRHGVS